MRKTFHKWFWLWDFAKEEKWLNEMADKGFVLTAVGFCRYEFEKCRPGEYRIRLELLDNVPENAESQEYIRFLEETGVEYVGKIIRWGYFRKKTTEGEFALFSDYSSRIRHLNRMLALLGVLFFVDLFNCFNIAINYYNHRINIILFCVILLLAVTALLGYGLVRIYLIKRKLVKEKAIFE